MTPDGLFALLSSVSCGAFVLATDQTVVFWNRRAREILGYTPDRVVGRRCSGIARGMGVVTLTDNCEEGCLMVRSLRAGLVPGRARLRMRCSWGEWKWLVVTPMVVSGVEDGGPLLIYMFGDSDEAVAQADIRRLVELGGGAGPGQQEVYHARPSNFLTEPGVRDEGSVYDPLNGVRGSADPGPDARGDERGDVEQQVLGNPGPKSTGEGTEADDRDAESGSARPDPRETRLTEREREVLSYLALGWETRYIAEELGVSWYTARNHIENLRRKLGASSRLQAVMVAMRLGIIPSE